jgi:2-hydroxychromene-2-carboxylate isomerase
MSRPTVEFWFEFASTYSYLSAMRIEHLAERAGVTVYWRPFLLGPIFKAQGLESSPFVVYPVKGQYMWRDMVRLCAAEGLPFLRPAIFPQHGLLAARVALVALAEDWGPAFVRAVYAREFAQGRDISEEDEIRAVLTELNQDPAKVLDAAASPTRKQQLRAQNEEAMRLGIFGAPSFVVEGELFWGNDRLEEALQWATRTV